MTEPASQMKNKGSTFSRWDFYAVIIFVVVVMFQAASWYKFPLFIDCYYHLSVIQGFKEAGGWVGEAFWEYAPVGRPHLYPPLFHILGLFLSQSCLGLIDLARLFDLCIYPIFLYCLWFVVRRLFSASLAFLYIFLLASSYSLYLAVVNNIPFTLAFLCGFFAFYFFERKKLATSCLFLVLAFYAHSLVPWLFMLGMRLYVFKDREGRRLFDKVFTFSLLLASPILFHHARYISFVKMTRSPDFYYAEFNFVLIILALIGLYQAYRRGGQYRYMVFLFFSLIILFFTHRHRFISGQGMVVSCFFAAVVLEDFWNRFIAKKDRVYKAVFWLGLFFVFHLFTVQYSYSPFKDENGFIFGDSLMTHWSGLQRRPLSPKDTSVYSRKFINEAVSQIRADTQEDDIVYANYSYGGGMLALLAGRATSSAMLMEVRPFLPFDPIASSRLILWFKEPEGGFPQRLRAVIEKYGLKKAEETSLVYLYLNERTHVKRKIIPSPLPSALCFVLLFLIPAVMLIENLRPLLREKCVNKS